MHSATWAPDFSPTVDQSEVRRHLVRLLTPPSFEHLAVALLQLENKEERSLHVGGSSEGHSFVINEDGTSS